MDAQPPARQLVLGTCVSCRAIKFLAARRIICHECLQAQHQAQRRQEDQERTLAFGLESSHAAHAHGSSSPSAAVTARKTATPLFVLCVTYLSNHVDLIDPEAIPYLPSEVRYFLFLLELSRRRHSSSSSTASASARNASSDGGRGDAAAPLAPRLRLAKRLLSSAPPSSSFEAFDFSALRSLTCLSPIQVASVFDHATSFGRPSFDGLRLLSLKGLAFVTDASLRTIAAQLRLLYVLDVSFCDGITDDGIGALVPQFRRAAQARDSWEELGDDDDDGENGDSSNDDDGGELRTETALLRGLLRLRRLGIYGCSQLTRATLKALRMAYVGRPTLTIYTSMLLVRSVEDDGHANAYGDRAVASAEWEGITDGAAAASASVDHDRDRVVDDDELRESRVVTFVNDILQWSPTEETAVYALHGYQIEEIEELRHRYYRRRPNDLGEGRVVGGRRQALPPVRKKPALYVDDDLAGEEDTWRDRKGGSGASRRGYLS